MVIQDGGLGDVLLVRKAGTNAFMFPGGKPKPGETPVQTGIREVKEEIGLEINPDEVRDLGVFVTQDANEAGARVKADVFHVDWGKKSSQPVAQAEIEELEWVYPDEFAVTQLPDACTMAPLTEVVLDALNQDEQLGFEGL